MYMYHFLYSSSDYWELCLASHHLTTTVNILWVLSLTTELLYCMCSCVGWMGEEIGLHAVCDWSYLKSQSVTTHSLHVLQWCCQLYTTSYRGRHCIWWASECVWCVCECVCVWVCVYGVCVYGECVWVCVCVCVCVWWVCVRVSVLDSKAFFKFVIVAIFFLMQNQSLISLLNFFNWFKSFSISTIPVTHHQNFKKNCSLTCLILYNRCQMLTCWLYQLYQQVCVCACVYGIPVLQMGALVVLLVESWAHNPEDTGSDPRAGG